MAQANTAKQFDSTLEEGVADDPLSGSGPRAGEDGNMPVRDSTDLPSGRHASVADLALIGNIPIELSMEIGRTRITIKELMSLGKGSVVELQRMADEPLDVLVNGTLVARGEAVVVGDRFGIRLTDVVSRDERLDGLG